MRHRRDDATAGFIIATLLVVAGLGAYGCNNRIETNPESYDGEETTEQSSNDSSEDESAPPDQDRSNTGAEMTDAGPDREGVPSCGDGLDNDGDGEVDLADADCDSFDDSETGDDSADAGIAGDAAPAETGPDEDGDPASDLTPLYRVNAGGPELSDSPTWEADDADQRSPYLSGAGQQFGSADDDDPMVTVGDDVPDGVPRPLFTTERWDGTDSDTGGSGEMTYQFDVDPGDYRVRIYLCETWQGATEQGVRRFDVTINRRAVLTDYDIYDDVGGFTGTVETFDVDLDDGASSIDVTFHHLPDGNNPMIAGLEVLER